MAKWCLRGMHCKDWRQWQAHGDGEWLNLWWKAWFLSVGSLQCCGVTHFCWWDACSWIKLSLGNKCILKQYLLMTTFNKVPLLLVLVFDCNVLVICSVWEIILASFYCCFNLQSSWGGGWEQPKNRVIACMYLLAEGYLGHGCGDMINSAIVIVCLHIVIPGVQPSSCIWGYTGTTPEDIHMLVIYFVSILSLLMKTSVGGCLVMSLINTEWQI